MSLGLSLGAFADGFAGGLSSGYSMAKKGAKDPAKKGPLDLGGFTKQQDGLGALPPPDGGTGVSASGASSSENTTAPKGGLVGLLDKTEGGGDYNTLFKFSNRDGGQFAGTKVTQMTLGDVYKFTDPSGDYGQWVKANNNGTTATPIGKFQFVGSTARGVAGRMGLPDDTPFNESTQDAMFQRHARDTLSGARTQAGKREALRGQWVGLKSIPDSELDAAIAEFETPNTTLGALAPAY